MSFPTSKCLIAGTSNEALYAVASSKMNQIFGRHGILFKIRIVQGSHMNGFDVLLSPPPNKTAKVVNLQLPLRSTTQIRIAFRWRTTIRGMSLVMKKDKPTSGVLGYSNKLEALTGHCVHSERLFHTIKS